MSQVLPAAATGPAAIVGDTDNAARLRQATRRRTVRGGWLIALVLILAALAAGTGWWFGSGPGSLVAVPDVRGATFAEAEAILGEQSLRAEERGEYSVDVESGLVIETDPPAGSRLDKDALVTVVVSQGPAEVALGRVVDLPADQVRELLAQNVISTRADAEFFTDAPAVTSYAQATACDVERFKRFFHGMLAEGVYLAPSAFEAGFVSAAHTEELIDTTVAAAARVMTRI